MLLAPFCPEKYCTSSPSFLNDKADNFQSLPLWWK